MDDPILSYEKPIITKLKSGCINRNEWHSNQSIKTRTHIDSVDINELINKFGSPLFVFSEDTIRKKIQKYKKYFSTSIFDIQMAWSYKTNYLDAICSIFYQEGFLAEVVSEMEYDKARYIGIPGNKIIFNGPNKSHQSLVKAIREGAKIHIDNFEEIEEISHIANKLNKIIDVGIRLNLDTGTYPLWSRFGFNLESGESLAAVKKIKLHSKLNLVGLHCHIGTFVLDPNLYKIQVKKMTIFSQMLEEKKYAKIKYIDLGGGLPSNSKLRDSYYHQNIIVPNMEVFAKTIISALEDNKLSEPRLKIFLENGRALIDDAGFLISTVKSTKRLPDGTKGYVIDAGINLLYTSTWYKFNIEINRQFQEHMEMSVLYGPLCMNIDVVDSGILLPPLNTNDQIILSPVGAYNVTQWMQFIEYRPAIVMIDTQRNPHLIRGKEDLTDLIRRESIPEHLAI